MSQIDENTQAYWRFIQGFILGQITVFILLYLLFKYWFLDDANKAVYNGRSIVSERVKNDLEKKRKLENDVRKKYANQPPSLSLMDAEILAKINYDLNERLSESSDWLNVLLAKIISTYRMQLLMDKHFIEALEEALNSDKKPGVLGSILLTDLAFGQEFPILKDLEIGIRKESSNVHVEALLSYSDQVSVGLDTSILIGVKGISLAALPISLNVSLVKFEGKVSLTLISEEPSNAQSTLPKGNETKLTSSVNASMQPHIYITVSPDYKLEFEVNTLLGHRTKLKDLPKVASLIVYKLKAAFNQKFVEPNGIRINVPGVESIINKLGKKEEIIEEMKSKPDGDQDIKESTLSKEDSGIDKEIVKESLIAIAEEVKEA